MVALGIELGEREMELYEFNKKYDRPYDVERLGHSWRIILHPMWKRLGLSIQFCSETPEKEIEENIRSHQMVAGHIVKLAGEEGFEEKYFYPDGHIRYYKVLDLAECGVAC